ncbi:hypothetical protein SteCoe_34626 [Stentor coeruleus]|uniref:Uncharacterized protein n=1 Tax=Stentor coeruleus TaxID=5963 RepID=A0A1R2AU38_9CILI|nr:hypothetical protein SteCoe_34626 [Stentor coeruleus]
MVKHGVCITGCEYCTPCEHRSSIWHDSGTFNNVKSSIWHDSGTFNNVNIDECAHFRYRLYCLTRNTFTPWGKPDEIAYKVDFTCKNCGSSYNQMASAQSFDENHYYRRIRCCGGSFVFAVELTSNTIENIFLMTAQIAATLGDI